MFRVLVVSADDDHDAVVWAASHTRAAHGALEILVPSIEVHDIAAVRGRAAQVLASAGVPGAVRTVEGFVDDEVARCTAPDLLVVGTGPREGRRGSQRVRRLLRRLSCPLAVVPDGAPEVGAPPSAAVVSDADDPALEASLQHARAARRVVVIVSGSPATHRRDAAAAGAATAMRDLRL